MDGAADIKGIQRIRSLDGLRALASLQVFMVHLPLLYFLGVAWKPWGRPFLDAKPGVTVFFVLSGLVLYFSLAPKPLTGRAYLAFAFRRILRIYPVYFLSLLLSAAILSLVAADAIPVYFERTAIDPERSAAFHFKQIVGHALLVVPVVDYAYLNPPIWALAVQMRVSLIFPFIVLLLRPQRPVAADVVIALVITAIFYVASKLVFASLFCTPVFVYGALLAKYWHRIIDGFRNWTAAAKVSAVASVPAIYFGAYAVHMTTNEDPIYIYISAIGACVLLVCVVGVAPLKTFFELPAVRHFGIASFGFYVFHQNVILAFTVIPALGENPWLIGICAFAASYLLAALSFRWIEHPINAWAKRRAAAWQKR